MPFNKDSVLPVDANRNSVKPSLSGKSTGYEAYVFDLDYAYGVGAMVLPEYYPVLLLKDGVALRNLQVDPLHLNLARLRSIQADDVGTWKRSRTKYLLYWPDDDEPSEVEIEADRPQIFQTGQHLDGEWTSISGGGDTSLGGSESFSAADTFRFFADGSFSAGRADKTRLQQGREASDRQCQSFKPQQVVNLRGSFQGLQSHNDRL